MICSNCGKNLSEGSKFCSVCGCAVVNSVPQPVQNNAPTMSAEPQMNASVSNNTAYQGQFVQNSVQPQNPIDNSGSQEQAEQEGTQLLDPDVNAYYYQEQAEQEGTQLLDPEVNAYYYQEQAEQDGTQLLDPEVNAYYYQEQNAENAAQQAPVANNIPGQQFVPNGAQPQIPESAPNQAQQFVPNGVQPQNMNGDNINVFYDVSQAKQKKKRKKMNKPLTGVISAVFGILIFVFSFVAVTVLCVKSGIESNAASEGIRELELDSLPVGDILSNDDIREMFENTGVKIPEGSKIDDANLAEAAADIINATVPDVNIKSSDVRKFLSKSDLQKLISEFVKAYEVYISTGDDVYNGDVSNKLKKAFKDNNDLADKLLGLELSYDFDEQFEIWMDDNYNTVSKIAPSKMLKSYDWIIGILMSPVLYITLLVLAVVMAVLVFIITKRLKGSILTFGISVFISGSAVTTAGLLVLNLGALIGFDFEAISAYIIPAVTGGFVNAFIMFGLITAGVGLAAIIASVVMMVISKKKNKDKNNEQPQPQQVMGY